MRAMGTMAQAGALRGACRLEKHMSAPLATIGAGEALDTAMSAFAEADAALVLVDGKPAGVVTRSDVLAFLGS
jgi:cystathionine beta-synthase